MIFLFLKTTFKKIRDFAKLDTKYNLAGYSKIFKSSISNAQ